MRISLRNLLALSCITVSVMLCAQDIQFKHTTTESNPFGSLNPGAAPQVGDYEELIGTCKCKSYSKRQDGSWAEPTAMTWTFKYIMNGTAVQDQTLKANGSHTGSIRQFHPDSAKWYVHYYTTKSPTTVLGVWEGQERKNGDDEIILYRPQKAPNGMDGFYKIRFFDISNDGFNWVGAWTNPSETFKLETWKIECEKQKL